jgi:hypothetical protein
MVTVVTKSSVHTLIFVPLFHVLIALLCTLETDDPARVAARRHNHQKTPQAGFKSHPAI